MRTLQVSAFVLFLLGLATLPLHAAETGSFDRTLQVSGTVDLDVTSGSGNIKVHTGNGTSVVVHATIHARDSMFGLSASEKIKRLQSNPPIEQQGNSIRVGRIDDHDLQQNVSIDYDVTVPPQTRVTSQTGSGDQTIDNVQLAVSARTGSGNITADNLGADARIKSGSGELRVTTVKGSLDAQTGSGNIRGRGIAGGITAATGSGEIEIEQVASGGVKVSAGSGNIHLRGIRGTLRADTGSGDVTVDGEPVGDWRIGAGSGNIALKIPSTAAFNIDARTNSGSLQMNHQVTMQGTFSRNHVQGKVGNGGTLVDIHTGSGDIHVD